MMMKLSNIRSKLLSSLDILNSTRPSLQNHADFCRMQLELIKTISHGGLLHWA